MTSQMDRMAPAEDDPTTDVRWLDAVFAALADPTRRAILTRLTQGSASVNELAEPFAMTTQSVSKHLGVLERAGLISRGRHAQWRPCHLQTAALDAAAAWLTTCRPPRR
jgi:DNA-binding transcriptional ArsR family regulator